MSALALWIGWAVLCFLAVWIGWDFTLRPMLRVISFALWVVVLKCRFGERVQYWQILRSTWHAANWFLRRDNTGVEMSGLNAFWWGIFDWRFLRTPNSELRAPTASSLPTQPPCNPVSAPRKA